LKHHYVTSAELKLTKGTETDYDKLLHWKTRGRQTHATDL